MALTDVSAEFNFRFTDRNAATALFEQIPKHFFMSELVERQISGRIIWFVRAHLSQDGSSSDIRVVSELLATHEPIERPEED